MTLKNLRESGVHTVFGGVIFCRADRKDINSLQDLKGKRFMAVERTSFGGWLMAWREFKDHNINPFRNFAEMRFGGTHDAVVYAVLNGEVDGGTVRTDTIERMSAEKKINMDNLQILYGLKGTVVEKAGVDFLHSTRLYPEWPFTKARHISNDLAQKVAVALLSMPMDSPAAKAAESGGWTSPLNYQAVHECLKELRFGPYKDFGKVTLGAAVRQHWYWYVILVAFFIFMGITIVHVTNLNRRLGQSRQNLVQANIRLKELDQLKSMFISSMSHELRTPLNSIIGFTGIILQGISGEITDDQRKELTIVKNNANHLLALISDVIDVSKIESGQIEPFIEEFDLADLMQEVKELFKVAVDEKGLDLSLKMPEGLMIKGDERRVKQIVMNLVSNALKFTDKGKIEINVMEKDGMVEASVADTGIGMREEDMDKLFKQFSRIYTKDRPVAEGAGLGLYLSQKIAAILGGKIKAESKFGKGSVFTLTLPLKCKEVTE